MDFGIAGVDGAFGGRVLFSFLLMIMLSPTNSILESFFLVVWGQVDSESTSHIFVFVRLNHLLSNIEFRFD